MAVVVIGVLIWILGFIAERNHGQPIDILGFGLIGNRGLVIYSNFIIAIGLCVAGLVMAVRRGVFWTRPLQRAVMWLPGAGRLAEKLALARLTWALHLTMNVAMDLRRSRAARVPSHGERLLHATHRPGREDRRGRPSASQGVRRAAERFPPTSSTRSRWPRRAAPSSSRWNGSRSATRKRPNRATRPHDNRRRRDLGARGRRDHPDDLPHRRLLHRHDQRLRCGCSNDCATTDSERTGSAVGATLASE